MRLNILVVPVILSGVSALERSGGRWSIDHAQKQQRNEITHRSTVEVVSARDGSDTGNQIVAYWGHTPGNGNSSLSDLCQQSAFDTLIIGWILDFSQPDGLPSFDFGTGCKNTSSASSADTSLCQSRAEQISLCQGLGKKIFLSVGGSSSNITFESHQNAIDAADKLWMLFGDDASSAVEQPFPGISVDGFDFDHENGSPNHFAAFAKSLRNTFKGHSKDIGLSACVSCAFTDPMPNNIYKEVDFVSVRFYNNAICNWGTSGFEDSLKTWCSTLARVACYSDAAVPKLYVGALAFNTTESGGSGYDVHESVYQYRGQRFQSLSAPDSSAITQPRKDSHTTLQGDSPQSEYTDFLKQKEIIPREKLAGAAAAGTAAFYLCRRQNGAQSFSQTSLSSTEDGTLNEKSNEKLDEKLDDWPSIPDPTDGARILTPGQIRFQKAAFCCIVLSANIACALSAIFLNSGTFVFVFILFIKAKDFLSVFLTITGLLFRSVRRRLQPTPIIKPQWILTLIPAYSESEEQIVKAIFSLRDNDVKPHRQVMCVLLDGKTRDIRSHMTRVIRTWERPYITMKSKIGTLKMAAGFMEDVPVLVLEKVKNAGKKDSLVLCHDLFNVPRKNIPLYTKLLRDELWKEVLPSLTKGHPFDGFDMVFCTDADSTIHKGALYRLANCLAEDKDVIAACGLVLVELEPNYEWSVWNLFQQFQYTFGQYVRRRAEDVVGKVTCLPGCITMIAVRPEMAEAIRKYAEPVAEYPVIAHQVQYLGTDRRLTYSMLSQGKKLKTRFIPEAVSETVAPQSFKHYVSQRRRWGSNSYFNNFYYCFGSKMILITRIAATMEIMRLSMVYYRVVNTALFIKGLIHSFSFMTLLPLLIVSQTPTLWFFFQAFVLEKELRKRAHKLVLGFCINKTISPIMSMLVFTKVITTLGSQGESFSLIRIQSSML
ncbi:hypothetical protein N0V83_002221 [Neocucurbitaria cava]|uniref:chitin synthase n=1 Tax=Neocucurbitaria cava TaxID=798079 RepID=A0A9W8YH28_9PLEO|nr:hypothetical protein N0V83_002221 [Neocucurbitaria cava]